MIIWEEWKNNLNAVGLYRISKMTGLEPYEIMGVEEPVKFTFNYSNEKLHKIERYINKIIELEEL